MAKKSKAAKVSKKRTASVKQQMTGAKRLVAARAKQRVKVVAKAKVRAKVAKAVKAQVKAAAAPKPKPKVKAAAAPTAVKKPRKAPNGLPIIIRGYSLGEIARQIGKTPGFLARCFKSTRKPSIDTLEAIRVFLKLDSLDEAAALFAPDVTPGATTAVKTAGAKVAEQDEEQAEAGPTPGRKEEQPALHGLDEAEA